MSRAISFRRFGRNVNSWPDRRTRAEAFATFAAGDPSKWTRLSQVPVRDFKQTVAFLALGLIDDEGYYSFLMSSGIDTSAAGDLEVIARFLASSPDALSMACDKVHALEAIVLAGRVRWIKDDPAMQSEALQRIRGQIGEIHWLIGRTVFLS